MEDGSMIHSVIMAVQGLNRVQQAPSVSKAMHAILWRCQQRLGQWVGSSVIHLGDHNVPNSLMFIDKYTQVHCYLISPLQLVCPSLWPNPDIIYMFISKYTPARGWNCKPPLVKVSTVILDVYDDAAMQVPPRSCLPRDVRFQSVGNSSCDMQCFDACVPFCARLPSREPGI